MSPIKLFGTRQVRSIWDAERELWFFSIVDVVSVLTDSADANAYWRELKQRLKAEGNEPMTNCHGLKMSAADGVFSEDAPYRPNCKGFTELASPGGREQSIPSPKAEPFRQWLAQVGSERSSRMTTGQTRQRALDVQWRPTSKKGIAKEWVNQRLKSMEVART